MKHVVALRNVFNVDIDCSGLSPIGGAGGPSCVGATLNMAAYKINQMLLPMSEEVRAELDVSAASNNRLQIPF